MDETERRLLGSQFDLDAKGYDDGRPDYPPEAWDLVLDHAELGPASTVVEIGPGTGQATARLLATGATVIAVEPGEALGGMLRDRFAGHRVDVRISGWEDVDLPAHSADAVCAATSFHWVDPDIGIAAIQRVLKPGAPLCLWWNVYRDPSLPDVDPIDTLVRGSTELPNTRGLNGILDELALPERLAGAGFVDITAHTVRWTGRHDEAQLIALFRSFSDMRKRSADERDRVLGRLRDHVRASGGSVERRYTTPVLLARAPS